MILKTIETKLKDLQHGSFSKVDGRTMIGGRPFLCGYDNKKKQRQIDRERERDLRVDGNLRERVKRWVLIDER